MEREPVIVLVTPASQPGGESGGQSSNESSDESSGLEDTLRQRYFQGYRVVLATPNMEPVSLLRPLREQGERVALFIYEQRAEGTEGAVFLDRSSAVYPDARKLLITDRPDAEAMMTAVNRDSVDYYLVKPWDPPDRKLYPVLDELLADWRASVELPFARVRGVMTVRAVRIRDDDTLHRAAEVIALSGISDLMVIDGDNNFVGVLSVGDVLRAAMPDTDEITEAGGTLDQAFRLFLRKGSELMYKPIKPLIIRDPLVVDPDDHVAKVAALMIEKNIHRLPVVKDGRLIGSVGRTDICQAVVGIL